jgi:hypothetical protein
LFNREGIGKMPVLPKLKITKSWEPSQEVQDLEQARDFLFARGSAIIVLVEGRSIISYEELVQLARSEEYKGRELLEVVMIPASPVGG